MHIFRDFPNSVVNGFREYLQYIGLRRVWRTKNFEDPNRKTRVELRRPYTYLIASNGQFFVSFEERSLKELDILEQKMMRSEEVCRVASI